MVFGQEVNKMSGKSTKWWALARGNVYANDYDFRRPISEKEFRAYLRDYWKVKSLKNFEIWKG